jgi:glycosyltransferase involved in cell wall biosynthesis
MGSERLAVISTHPVQYHAPVYREVERLGVPLTAIYGSDFSVAGYHDREFNVAFSWSTDLLSGYSAVFLSRVSEGGANTPESTSGWRLSRALRQIRPAAVLVTGYWPAYFRQSILQLLIQRQRILFRAETTDHARSRHWLLDSTRDLILQHFYQRCSCLLYIGKRSRDHFERLGSAGREMYFSPYCVDASAFEANESARERQRNSTRAELELVGDQIALLFAGKLVSRKGPDLLVDALEGIPAELRNRVVVVFLGDGDMRAMLAVRSESIAMRFVGFKNQNELSRFYHASDALVLPSRSGETWGLVVNEALLHGLPCVVSQAVGCSPDLVIPGVTGEVFETNSALSLRQALIRCIAWQREDPGMRMRCREQVERFSVRAAAEGIVAAFEAALGKDFKAGTPSV